MGIDHEIIVKFIEHLINKAIEDTDEGRKLLVNSPQMTDQQLARIENACVTLGNRVGFLRSEITKRFSATPPVKESSHE